MQTPSTQGSNNGTSSARPTAVFKSVIPEQCQINDSQKLDQVIESIVTSFDDPKQRLKAVLDLAINGYNHSTFAKYLKQEFTGIQSPNIQTLKNYGAESIYGEIPVDLDSEKKFLLKAYKEVKQSFDQIPNSQKNSIKKRRPKIDGQHKSPFQKSSLLPKVKTVEDIFRDLSKTCTQEISTAADDPEALQYWQSVFQAGQLD